MNILERIVDTKKTEIIARKMNLTENQLELIGDYHRVCNSLKDVLLQPGSSGIIAEFKQKSPSRGVINTSVTIDEVTSGYALAGATGLSILTDYEYFGGSLADLVKAREGCPRLPVLRKDFIIDPYQVAEAKAFGADVILLIAACLEKNQAEMLAKKAKSLGLEVLMEIHNAEEIEKMNDFVDLVGVNNRNLKTMEVDVETSVKLADKLPAGCIKISESGLSSAKTINYLKDNGFKGFLIGETFMKTKNPGEACRNLITELGENAG